jgi:formylmethanofuran dehydrogenase subunit D
MNERIKEFMQRAGTDSSGKWMGVEHAERFAELIVQECANICFSEADGHRIAFGEHCGIVIKQHFGVEE